MPCFNVATLISRAIDSVLQQSFGDWELIVVDDGSSDNIYDVVNTYANKDKRIRMVSKPNGGLSDARNFGLSNARGKYIHFFDPDDYLNDQEWYKTVFIAIDGTTSIDVVITGYNISYEKSGELFRFVQRPLIQPFGGKFGHDCINHVCYAWNKLFRREFLVSNGLKYEKGLSRIEDAEFMSRVIEFKPTIKFIKDGGYVYVQRPVQTLSKGFDERIIEINCRRINIDTKLITFFQQESLPSTKLIDFLKMEAIVATINRLYSYGGDITTKKRFELLNRIRVIIPQEYNNTRRGSLRNFFDCLLYLSMKFKLFWLTDMAQRFRR